MWALKELILEILSDFQFLFLSVRFPFVLSRMKCSQLDWVQETTLVLQKAGSLCPGFVTVIRDAEEHRCPGVTLVHSVPCYPGASLLILSRKGDRQVTQNTRGMDSFPPLFWGLQGRKVIFSTYFLI